MTATSLERLVTILCCLSVVESARTGVIDRGLVDGSSNLKASSDAVDSHIPSQKIDGNSHLKGGGDDADSHILLQKFVSNAIDDHVRGHDTTAREGGVHAAQSQAQFQRFESWSSFWTHPLILGILLGLFLIGPDHLGTLAALSTLRSGLDSFKAGFTWGVGHSVGVMLLCPIFLGLEHITSNSISRESWEYYGDIFIGISMITVGVYFVYYQDSYLQRREDGTYVVSGCVCHGPSPSTTKASILADRSKCNPCSPVSTDPVRLTPEDAKDDSEERIDDSTLTWQFIRNSLLGLLQGLCCPLGMTAGTGFMSRVTATARPPMLVAFLVEFALASGVGSGLIALGWGGLTMMGSRSCISGRFLYIATCTMLLLFGVVWLVAHSLGVLHHIDFGHKIHSTLMPAS